MKLPLVASALIVALTQGCAAILGFEDAQPGANDEQFSASDAPTSPDAAADETGTSAESARGGDASAPVFADDFSSPSPDTRWREDATAGTTFARTGELSISVQVPSGPTTWGSYQTTNAWPFQNAQASIAVRHATVSNASVYFEVSTGGPMYEFSIGAGGLGANRRIDSTWTTMKRVTYDAAAHAALRIRHDGSKGEVIFETRARTASTWVTFHREPWALGSTDVFITFGAERYGPDSNPQPARFDDFAFERN